MGGMAKAVESGMPKMRIEECAARKQAVAHTCAHMRARAARKQAVKCVRTHTDAHAHAHACRIAVRRGRMPHSRTPHPCRISVRRGPVTVSVNCLSLSRARVRPR